jgi:hypothetical protein
VVNLELLEPIVQVHPYTIDSETVTEPPSSTTLSFEPAAAEVKFMFQVTLTLADQDSDCAFPACQ